jgi:hypothetical protein
MRVGEFTGGVSAEDERSYKFMINALSIPSPFCCNSGTSKTVIDVYTIYIDCCALTTCTCGITKDDCEGLILICFNVGGCCVCDWVEMGSVFGKREGSIRVIDCCREAFVAWHCGEMGW